MIPVNGRLEAEAGLGVRRILENWRCRALKIDG
jgi:hypothetical protein